MTDVDKALFCALLSYCRTVRFRGVKKLVNNECVAMVGYDDFTANSFQMHIWLKNAKALDRNFIRECFRYPFELLGLGIAITVVACNNVPALELTRRLGWKRRLTIKDGYALGTDLAIQELRREECPWLRIPNGRQVEHTSST